MAVLHVRGRRLFLGALEADWLARADVLYLDDTHGEEHFHINPEMPGFEEVEAAVLRDGVAGLRAVEAAVFQRLLETTPQSSTTLR